MVLVEAEQALEDGRVRQRNMLVAEKKELADDETPGFAKPCFAAAIRGLCEELSSRTRI